MQQKREKQRVSGESSNEEADVKERSSRCQVALMGNISGTNIAYYSTVRQKNLLGPLCAPGIFA
jgi:hypothetical protein